MIVIIKESIDNPHPIYVIIDNAVDSFAGICLQKIITTGM